MMMNPAFSVGSLAPGLTGSAPLPPGRMTNLPGSGGVAGGCAAVTHTAERRNSSGVSQMRMTRSAVGYCENISLNSGDVLTISSGEAVQPSSSTRTRPELTCLSGQFPAGPVAVPAQLDAHVPTRTPGFLASSVPSGLAEGYNFPGTDATGTKQGLCLLARDSNQTLPAPIDTSSALPPRYSVCGDPPGLND